jgi:hypothetical protein
MTLIFYRVRQWFRAVAAKRLTRKLWLAELRRLTKHWPKRPGHEEYLDSLCESYRPEGYTPREALEEEWSYGD